MPYSWALVDLQIISFRAEYENGDRSADQLLRACTRLDRPRLKASVGGLLLKINRLIFILFQ